MDVLNGRGQRHVAWPAIVVASLALALLCAASTASAEPAGGSGLPVTPVPGQRWDAIKVFIDPGHGGPYSNSNHYGLSEKNVNLWLSLELRRQLLEEGYPVGIARTTDTAVCTHDIPTWKYSDGLGLWQYRRDYSVPKWPPTDDLQARADMANAMGADVFISIHNNGSVSTGPRGTETWATPDDDLGRSLSRYVQKAMIEQTGMVDRSYHTINFYVIRWANMPAILIEGGFLSNPTDARLLKRASFRTKLVRGMVIGFERWLATKPYRAVYPRIKGAGPAQVSVSATRAGWSQTASTVILASALDPADALSVAPLSRKLAAPVLLVSGDSLDASQAAEVARLSPGRVIALGPETAVSSAAVTSALDAAGLTSADARRIAGADRYETAALVAAEVGLSSRTVVISSGAAMSEALSGGLYAAFKRAPLLLTESATSLSPATKAYLVAHATEIDRVVVVGRKSSVSDGAVAGLPGLRRIDGVDRFALNTGVLRALFPQGGGHPLVVAVTRPAEALAAQVLAVRQSQPMLLTGGRVMSPYTRLWISNMHNRVGSNWTLVGGYTTQPVLTDWLVRKAAH
jgi:N-acetylmuramoyl-L-alanine amidase/putative cell wall-binding protein